MNFSSEIAEPEFLGFQGRIRHAGEGMFLAMSGSIPEPGALYLSQWFTRSESRGLHYRLGRCRIDSPRAWGNYEPSFTPLCLEGLPFDDFDLHLPNVLLRNGRYELFAWLIGHGLVRQIMAAGSDGIHFEVLNFERPGLYHFMDNAVRKDASTAGLVGNLDLNESGILPADGRSPAERAGLISNDSMSVGFDQEQGIYWMYHVVLADAALEPQRRIEYDNVNTGLRRIVRRTSRNGLDWSRAKPVFSPESGDPVDLQFYGLTTTRIPGGCFGSLSYYPAAFQTMDIEPAVFSGGVWRRLGVWKQLREKTMMNGRPAVMLMPGMTWRDGDDILISAVAADFLHNQLHRLTPEHCRLGNALFRLPLHALSGVL